MKHLKSANHDCRTATGNLIQLSSFTCLQFNRLFSYRVLYSLNLKTTLESTGFNRERPLLAVYRIIHFLLNSSDIRSVLFHSYVCPFVRLSVWMIIWWCMLSYRTYFFYMQSLCGLCNLSLSFNKIYSREQHVEIAWVSTRPNVRRRREEFNTNMNENMEYFFCHDIYCRVN